VIAVPRSAASTVQRRRSTAPPRTSPTKTTRSPITSDATPVAAP